MVNWISPAELASDAAAFNNLVHTLAGVYIWEFATTLPFEWKFISGKRVFRWPLIFYFLGRYCLLFALIGVLVAQEIKTDINCQALYIFNEIMGNASIGCASINLSLRTMAIWKQNKWIVISLTVLILGHWSLLMQGILLHAEWIPGEGCVITKTKSQLLAITFIYSMILDFIVMCLTGYKLLFIVSGRSPLMNLIFKDGLIYFIIAFLSNVLATVFMLLDWNPTMSIIFNVPAAIASTLVACRAVRRLMKFAYRGPEEYTVEGDGTNLNIAFRRGSATVPPIPALRTPSNRGNIVSNNGVHVQLETFTVGDDATPSPSSYLSDYVYGEHRDRTGGARRRSFDVEEQKLPDELYEVACVSVADDDPAKHNGLAE